EMLERLHPSKAVGVLDKIIKLAPGEFPLKVKLVELYEASNWSSRAFEGWRNLAAESRRLGRPDDRARFQELALRLRPGEQAVLVEAAAARLDMNDAAAAMPHLQKAYAAEPGDRVVLALLGRAFDDLEQNDKAQAIWLESARVAEEQGDAIGEAEALRKALDSGADDPDLKARFAAVDERAARFRLRLHDRPWARDFDSATGAIVIRAEVQERYGFPGRARETLEAATGSVRTTAELRIALAELLVRQEDAEGALFELEQVVPPTAEAAEELAIRRAILGGNPDGELLDDDAGDDVVDDDLDDDIDDELDDELDDDLDAELDDFDDELVDDDPTDAGSGTGPSADSGGGLVAEGDALAAAGDREGALDAYRRALQADPTDEDVLRRIADVMASGAPAPAPPEPDPFDFGPSPDPLDFSGDAPDFSNVFGGEGPGSSSVAPSAPRAQIGGASLADARAWMSVGAFDRAASATDASLAGRLLLSESLAASGDTGKALNNLRDAVDDADESDPVFLEALLTLAGLSARAGKLRGARRLLDEIEDSDAGFRPDAVADVRRGIALLKEG
ncbi:MAG: tetratricopeptide repeat protein, partial [Myxococcota bacterium]|nr:tetratricopeptide repeat protein [Myxococcota bacterium]